MFNEKEPANSYVNTLEESGNVDVVIYVHDHNYECTKNIKGYR